jgi:2'-5' RNA ligase
MRLFVGVWLSEAMLEEVANYIKLVRQNCSGFKWTSPQNLHFTMKFLGEIPENRLKELSQALRSAAAENETFSLRLGSTGFFPQHGAPRIVWIGVAQGQTLLVKLAQSVESYCLQHGFTQSDKQFRPHLTIARSKPEARASKIVFTDNYFKSETVISGFSLIESCLTSKGPIYRSLENFNLNRVT